MKKRISFIIIILILVSAFMISASADYINTFQFIQNLTFTTQTNHTPSQDIIINPRPIASDDGYSVHMQATDTTGQPVDYSYNFIAYGFHVFANTYPSDIEYTEITIPFNLNIQAGASIKIPFIYVTSRVFSISSLMSGSYFTLGNDRISFTQSNISTNSILGYINNVYTNVFTVKYNNSNGWDKCQYLYMNLSNNTSNDVYVSSVTIRLSPVIGLTQDQILFPFVYEGDELISYTPPNPYNIPILKDINNTLNLIISKLVSGDSSVADLLDTVISMIESLDTNIGSIDSNIVQIVSQLNFLSSLDASNSNINSTLIDIRRMLHDFALANQDSPVPVFTQAINENQHYINTEKGTVNRYKYANEDKDDIYRSTSSGLTYPGGTYDYVADLAADAGTDQGFNGIFGLIFGDSNISGIILTVIALGTISYILYGKRG